MRLESRLQSFQSFSSLNSGKSASVHDGDSAFSGSYTGLAIFAAVTRAFGTSSIFSRSESSSAVLS